ncbi:MAG: hypothetical protein GC149_15690 [Gammaproteobacteria bacterium]|nr:hypothetical protein [Gammaproteobacteria bacterium]
MRIGFTSSSSKEVEPVLEGLCTSLQHEFEAVFKSVDISQTLDLLSVIVTAVDDEIELNQCRCAAPVSVSSNENFVTGEKARTLTLRLSLRRSSILQHGAVALRHQVLAELINTVSGIKTKRVLDEIDRDKFVQLIRSKIA